MTTPPPIKITDEMIEPIERAIEAGRAADLLDAGELARRAAEAVAPLIAAQVLREAAEAHASDDDAQDDYVGHDDRCDIGPPPCDCPKGRTARWLDWRADVLLMMANVRNPGVSGGTQK